MANILATEFRYEYNFAKIQYGNFYLDQIWE